MAEEATTATPQWSSRWIFLMAAIGFAVGPGNIWRFPYVMGENGGGAFLIIYLVAAFLIGVPLVIAELSIGRRGGGSPVHSILSVAAEAGASRSWAGIGMLAVISVFLISSFVDVITGWTFEYIYLALSGQFSGLTSKGSEALFNDIQSDPWRMAFWAAIIVVLKVVIVSRGLNGGVEKAVNILMPMLFICLLVMLGYGLVAGDVSATVDFLLNADFSKVTPSTVLIAVGQAFFSIGIAAAGLIAFGAYIPKHVSLPQSAAIIVLADTGVAVIAGFAIFPIVFAYGLAASDGPGLTFLTMPLAFGAMPGGHLIGAIFFLLLAAASITSGIGALEAIVSWVREVRGTTRKISATVTGIAGWIVGLGTVLSFNYWKDFHPLDFIPLFAGKTPFEIQEFVVTNVLLLVGGLMTAIFAGWVFKRTALLEELGGREGFLFSGLRLVLRYLAPFALFLLLYLGIVG